MLWDKQAIPQKAQALFIPVLRNVTLPFWRVSTFPNTIFGNRGVEQSRWSVRVAIAYYVNCD